MIAMIHFTCQHISRADAADAVRALDIDRDSRGLQRFGRRLVSTHCNGSPAVCEQKGEDEQRE
jgi:hypothetical protein